MILILIQKNNNNIIDKLFILEINLIGKKADKINNYCCQNIILAGKKFNKFKLYLMY